MTLRALWIGTYPEAGAGTPVGLGEGIWQVSLDTATGSLGTPRQVATLPSPAFLASARPHDGAAHEEAAPEETAPEETVRDETVRDEAVRDEAVRDEAVRDEAVREEAVRGQPPRGGAPDDETPDEEAADDEPRPGTPFAGTLYATIEDDPGVVATLTVQGGRLVERSRTASGGSYPCHLLTDVPGVLAVANYGTGTLGVLPLDADGTPTAAAPDVHGTTGQGPRADRQEGPHAHFVAVAPGERHLLVVDLGTDRLRRYRLTGTHVEPDGDAVVLPPGTGPRHLGFAADGRFGYVVGELDAQVHVLAWEAGTATGTLVQSVPAVVGPSRPPHDGRDARDTHDGCDERGGSDPGDEQGDDPVRHGGGAQPSHLEVVGAEVLVAVRGTDVLTRYSIGRDGLLSAGRSHDLGGHWPRHFAVVDGWAVVALERAHALVVLDPVGTVVSRAALPSPTCVLPTT